MGYKQTVGQLGGEDGGHPTLVAVCIYRSTRLGHTTLPVPLSPCQKRTISHAAAGPLLSALVRDTPTVCMVILMATTSYLLVVVMHAQTGLVSWPPARAARPSSGRFCARQTLSKSPNKHLQCAGHCAWCRGVRRARLQPRSGVVLLVILLPRQTSGRRLADVWRTSGGRLSVR